MNVGVDVGQLSFLLYSACQSPKKKLPLLTEVAIKTTVRTKLTLLESILALQSDLPSFEEALTGKQFMFRDERGEVVLAAAGRFVFTADLQTLVAVHGMSRTVCNALVP